MEQILLYKSDWENGSDYIFFSPLDKLVRSLAYSYYSY